MSDKPSAANVLRIFRAGTAQDVRTGRLWYRRAHDVALELADMGDGDVTRAACVLGVISPSMPWGRNETLAREAYRLAADGADFDAIVAGLGMMKENARKAAAIVLGADPWSIISGPKVIPFAQRIIDAAAGSTGPGSVVVDRHAHDIALGRVTDDKTRNANLSRKGGQRAYAMCYVRAAAALRRSGEAPGITPSEVQAVTWIIWRREHAHSQARAESRREARNA